MLSATISYNLSMWRCCMLATVVQIAPPNREPVLKDECAMLTNESLRLSEIRVNLEQELMHLRESFEVLLRLERENAAAKHRCLSRLAAGARLH
jgi:hypothetical protein